MLAPEPGTEIDGFRLGERMHVGSMASIYRLEGPRGPLPLIMNIPRLGAGEGSANVVSFEQCRMVLGALSQSPHHPALIAYGDVETTPYLVMEYIEGTRLDSWIERAPLAPQETARLGHALALALHEVHRQDVIHLDLKATNVLFRASGEAALIDFGLSCHRHLPDLLAAEFHSPVGNWVYMAPEQIAGRGPRAAISPPRARPAPAPDVGPLRALGVAMGTQEPDEPFFEALRSATRRRVAADGGCRIACITVVPPAAALADDTPTGRHIKQLVSLRRWAKPLGLPEERLTYHVLESDQPAAALLDYAAVNEAEESLMGFGGNAGKEALQVAAQAPCSVTIVRPPSLT